jgi:hypothetical protein
MNEACPFIYSDYFRLVRIMPARKNINVNPQPVHFMAERKYIQVHAADIPRS